jgi:hypothetical protein
MKILITGGGSNLAKFIGQELNDYGHSIFFASSKLSQKSLFFDLTKGFSDNLLDSIDCVIHIAKNPNDEFNEIERNFLKAISNKNLILFYIGSTSSYLESPNQYGKYKKSVEDFIIKSGGVCITCGLIYGDGYVGQLSKIKNYLSRIPFNLSIKNAHSVYLTPVKSISIVINDLVKNKDVKNKRLNLFFPREIRFNRVISELSGRKLFTLSINLRIIELFLSLFPIKLNHFNLDRLKALTSNFVPELIQNSEDYTIFIENYFLDNFYTELTKES